MKSMLVCAALQLAVGCAAAPAAPQVNNGLIGQDSFALAARLGVPAGYQLQGDYMQLDYGTDAAGCHLIVLIDQAQRVVGWASTGKDCGPGHISATVAR